MCVEQGKSGSHIDLGDHGLLRVELSIENPLFLALNQSVVEDGARLNLAG